MNKKAVLKIIEWLIHVLGYTIVLLLTSLIFKKTIFVDSQHYYLWGFIAILIIYILNKTVKPLLFWLTLPITGLTLGLFYPVINIVVLKITDLMLFNHFEIRGIVSLFFASIFISLLNTIMDHLLVNKIVKGVLK